MSGTVRGAENGTGGADGEGHPPGAATALITTSASRSAVARTSERGPLISLTPMERRLVMSVGRFTATIADGLFLSSTALSPVMTVASLAYDSFRVIRNCHRGELNALGHPTSLTDVALNVGKSVGTAAIGVAIGHAVGTLVGLSAIPVAGQIVVATLLSVSLGLCIDTLLTRFADRLFVRLRLQAQYGYSPSKQKARRRFEQLLEAQHDLSSFETCRIVQHYRDYRVACGWEGHSDLDDYRASANIIMMPVSFRHFAIVQLQRKWGFLNKRGECKKVYKALMQVHHPDKGGDGDLAAQLNHDYEIYAFCQGWQEDCPSMYENEAGVEQGNKPSVFKKRRNTVVNFLRSLFLPVRNSFARAEDLRQNGLMALEAGTPPELHRLDTINGQIMDEEEDEVRHHDSFILGTSALVQQRSVSRMLAAIRRCYQLATEAITFAGLVHLSSEREQWQQLEHDIFLFNRLQTYLNVVADIPTVQEGEATASVERSCCGVRWRTKEEAVAMREEKRLRIVSCCFPPSVSSMLTEALDLWATAQSLAESFFKHSSSHEGKGGRTGDGDGGTHVCEGTGQTLDTLLNIQKTLQEMTDRSTRSWMGPDGTLDARLSPQFVERVRALGLTASFALAGAHASGVHEGLWKNCEEFFKTRQRKLDTVTSLLNEIHELRARLGSVRAEARKELQMQHDDLMKQLFLMHYVLAEVDAAVMELYDVYTAHLPEKSETLKTLSSSCAKCVHKDVQMSRFAKYERERTLMNYMNIETEPRNAMDPFEFLSKHKTGPGPNFGVEFALLHAQYVDPITGTVTPCWLKRYTFPTFGGNEAQNCAVTLFEHIMEYELRIPQSCTTHRVTCVTDVFCDAYTRELFFHIPRGGTQLRFGSSHDINKRIFRLGLRWLHDALQCIIDLHSCQLVHGTICVSNFTYDDFGNTSLGFFSSAVRDRARDAPTPLDDAVDFGALLRAEVLPYLLGPSPADSPARRSPTVAGREDLLTDRQQPEDEVIRVFREVADRLIGKAEPRWTLLDARAFVRRFLEFRYDSDERNYLFTKEVSYPAYWAVQKSIAPVSLVADRRVFSELPAGAVVFLNRNVYLWELYWKCRREMVQKRGGGFFSMPAVLGRQASFLLSGDDCEVNERFLWHTCDDEEEAWRICLEGVGGKRCRLRLLPPWTKPEEGSSCRRVAPTWGVVLRVSLGTVVESDRSTRNTLECCGENKIAAQFCEVPFLEDTLERSAEQHCVLMSDKMETNDLLHCEVIIPSPRVRCYPEYIVCQLQAQT